MRRAACGRGSVLVMALLVVTIGALVGTSIIYYAGANRRAAGMGVRRVQARAMAWSGVQAVMSELAEQRDELLAGEPPRVTESWSAPEMEGAVGGEKWGFRVLPVGTQTLWSEMGRLDVNNVPAEVLAKLPGMTEELAGRVVTARGSRRFTSVPELLSVPGMTHELLYGALDTGANGEAGGTAESAADGSGERSGEAGGEARGLSRYVTVYSFDPEVQVGTGAKASETAGKQRININAAWSEELGEAIEERFDKGVADGVKGMIERGEKFEKPSSIVKNLRELRVPTQAWVDVLDAFTTNPDQFRLGAVDLLTAPAVVLECVPGIAPEAAAEIVARREKLDSLRRGTVAWPVLEDILTPEDFEKAVDYLTSRSLQWRVVVEGGVFGEDEGFGESGPDWEGGRGDLMTDLAQRAAPLRDRVVFEAVIDVSSLRARVAYLREVTFLPTARQLALADLAASAESVFSEQTANDGGEILHGVGNQSLPGAFHTELDSDPTTGQRLDAGDEDRGLEFGGLDEGEEAGEGGGTEEEASRSGDSGGEDKRVGRWTSGSGGSRE